MNDLGSRDFWLYIVFVWIEAGLLFVFLFRNGEGMGWGKQEVQIVDY
jgi:hypothetical protein